MQIREVELTTGLERANIRYYEKEGLLHPARGENGYREYAQADVETRFQHPWRRFFARGLDVALALLLLCVLWFGLLGRRIPLNLMNNALISWLVICLQWAVVLVLEPLCLSKWGATPGKWLMGLRLTNAEGGYLTYAQAQRRTWGVLCWGEGFCIPIYGLIRQYLSYAADAKGSPLRWEEDELYTCREAKWYRDAGFVAGRIGVYIVTLLLAFSSMLPCHRGALTTEEYLENFNDYYHYFAESRDSVNAQGVWQEAEEPEGGVFEITLPDREAPRLDIREENGVVAAVSFTDSDEAGDNMIFGFADQTLVAYMALLGAQKGVSGAELLLHIRQANEFQDVFSDFGFTYRGVRVTNEADWTGYEHVGNGMLFAMEEGDEAGTFRQVFTVELTEKNG